MKKLLKSIGLVLVIVLFVGSISVFFDKDTDSGSSSDPPTLIVPVPDVPEDLPCTHRDSDDNGACDKCAEAYEDGQDLFGGTTVNNLTFADPFSKSILAYGGDFNTIQNGLSFGGIKAGTVSSSGDHLHFYTDSLDVEANVTSGYDSMLSFYFLNAARENNHVTLPLSTVDYVTVDFDVWTDMEYFKTMTFHIAGKDASGGTELSDAPRLCILRDDEGSRLINSSTYETLYEITNPKSKLHVTYVIEINHTSMADSKVLTYVNGVYISDELNKLTSEFAVLDYLRVYFGTNFVAADNSVCFDDYVVNIFGSGDGAYSGELIKLFESTEMKLTENVDSVLYNK